MKLHRSTGQPDWQGVKPAQHNRWQKLANQTNGIVTPGNVVSLVGLILVLLGLLCIMREATSAGLVLIAIGRLCDILDGLLADQTGTKSPLGERIDATSDKVGTFATLIVVVIAGIVPWWVALLLCAPNVANALLTLLAIKRGAVLHPSAAGKLAMASAWGSLLCFILLVPLELTGQSIVGLMGYILAFISTVLGICAAWGYASNIRSGDV